MLIHLPIFCVSLFGAVDQSDDGKLPPRRFAIEAQAGARLPVIVFGLMQFSESCLRLNPLEIREALSMLLIHSQDSKLRMIFTSFPAVQNCLT